MAGSGSVAVLLPGAFYFLGETRVPPIDGFRQAGADGRSHRSQPRHLTAALAATRDEYGLHAVRTDGG